MQYFTTIQGLLLVSVNIILFLKMENNRSGNTLLAEQLATSHLCKRGLLHFSFNTEPFYRCRTKRVCEPRGAALGARCIAASRDLGQTIHQPLKSLQSLSEFKYSSQFSSSVYGLPTLSLLEVQIFLETLQWHMITVTSFYFARLCGSLGSNSGATKRATVFRLKNTLLTWPLVT